MPASTAAKRTENITAIVAMIFAMAGYVSNDACVKLVGERLPLGETIVLRNVIATGYILLFALIFGGLRWPRVIPTRLVTARTFGEVMSTVFFLTGLMALPIADATAITQFLPLAITAAAAILFKEHVGWRLWLATAVGLGGVLLIVRPGTGAFSPYAVLILLAVGLMVLRDLTTRQIGPSLSTLTLTLLSSVSVIFAGLMLMPFEDWIWPDKREIGLLMLGGLFLACAYALSVVAMRQGDVAVVSPFRYSIIVFALILGWLVWDQWPDRIQMLGIAVLTAAGLYTLHHRRIASIRL